jgi:hypothetical protein
MLFMAEVRYLRSRFVDRPLNRLKTALKVMFFIKMLDRPNFHINAANMAAFFFKLTLIESVLVAFQHCITFFTACYSILTAYFERLF